MGEFRDDWCRQKGGELVVEKKGGEAGVVRVSAELSQTSFPRIHLSR